MYQDKIFLSLVALAAGLIFTGCEEKRYQPSEWNSTTLPAATAGSDKSTVPPKPTNWLDMVGKGGQGRNSSLPTTGGRTLPGRGTSLPARGQGMTLPARQMGNGTTIPMRQQTGNTLPRR